jgi:hypothetical protein
LPLTCCNILQHGTDGFLSPPKEVVLRIAIALETPSSSAGFEPENFESNGKHDNHYTTKNDNQILIFVPALFLGILFVEP